MAAAARNIFRVEPGSNVYHTGRFLLVLFGNSLKSVWIEKTGKKPLPGFLRYLVP